MVTTNTWDIGGGANDYTTVTLAEADRQGDLVSDDRAEVFRVFDGASAIDENITIDGSTTDATRYMKVVANAGDEFNMNWASPSGVYYQPTSSGHVFTISDPFFRVEGIGTYRDNAGGSSDENYRLNADADDFYALNCAMRGDLGLSSSDGIYCSVNVTGIRVENCFFKHFARAAFHAQIFTGNHTQTWFIYNCVVSECERAFGYNRNDGGVSITLNGKNNVALFSGGDVRSTGGSPGGTFTNNIDFCGTTRSVTTWGAATEITNTDPKNVADLTTETATYFVFENWQENPLIIDDDGETWTNALLDGGEGPDDDSSVPTEDWEGDTRPDTPCAIGFDELASGAAAQGVTDAGIAHTNAIGAETVDPGAVEVTDSGVAHTNAIGQESVELSLQEITDSGVATTNAIGAETVDPGAVGVTDSGVASTSAVGTETVAPGAATVGDVGVASTSAVGAENVSAGAVEVADAGVAHTNAVGTETVTAGSNIGDVGVASTSAVGTESVELSLQEITDAGVATTSAVGAETVDPGAVGITDVGVASISAVGEEALELGAITIGDVGVASTSAVGTEGVELLLQIIGDSGVASTSAVGEETVELFLQILGDIGVASTEAVGTEKVLLAIFSTGVWAVVRSAVRARFESEIVSALFLSVNYDNDPDEAPISDPWIQVRIDHGEGQIVQGGGGSGYRYRTEGVVEAEIFAEIESGTGDLLTASDAIKEAFRDFTEDLGENSIIYATPFLTNNGSEGKWHSVTISIPWRYDFRFEQTIPDDLSELDGDFFDAAKICRDRFFTHITTAESVVTQFDNAPDIKPKGDLWASFTVLQGSVERVQAGSNGLYRTLGIATASIFTKLANGDGEAIALADKIGDVFRTSEDRGVSFEAPLLRRIGREGELYRIDVRCPFISDQE